VFHHVVPDLVATFGVLFEGKKIVSGQVGHAVVLMGLRSKI
jgi:hypothetical protein